MKRGLKTQRNIKTFEDAENFFEKSLPAVNGNRVSPGAVSFASKPKTLALTMPQNSQYQHHSKQQH